MTWKPNPSAPNYSQEDAPTVRTVPPMGRRVNAHSETPTAPIEHTGPVTIPPFSRIEDLRGGEGRSIVFRPDRFRARDLILNEPLKIQVDGKPFILDDIAVAGLAYKMPANKAVIAENQVVAVEVQLRRETVYAGQAKVVRIDRRVGSSWRVALELLSGFIDLPMVRELDEVQRFRQLLNDGASAQRQQVPVPYQAIIAEMVHFITTWEAALLRRQYKIMSDGNDIELRLRKLTDQVFEAIVDEWRGLVGQAGTLIERLAPTGSVRDDIKRYTETMVTARLLGAPLVHQAFEKPMGYPGDYRTMHQIYANQRTGSTPMAAVVQGLLCDDIMSRGVRSRKDFMKQTLGAIISQNSGRPLRILSLGCGPAREVSELVAEWPDSSPDVEWVLVDQEIDALRDAHDSTYRAVSSRKSTGRVRCLHLSFAQMVEDPSEGMGDTPFDVIYCTGLTDYLDRDKARQMVDMLLGRVVSSGHLIVANALSPSAWNWACEFLLDWRLVYRTQADLRTLVTSAAPVATVTVDQEPQGVFGFLHLRKR
jgi:extracellular factor (EF) 3-hydroxypalmitic acid methyl ester biosynthesis protein